MLRIRLPGSLALLAAGLAACSNPAPTSSAAAAPAPAAQPAKVEIEAPRLLDCPSADPGRECEEVRASAPADFKRALGGDYQAQRNTAYMFATARVGMVKRPVQACAWRMVIMAERPANGMPDAGNYQTDCGTLSPRDRQAARQVAQAIHRQVYGSDLPELPPLDA